MAGKAGFRTRQKGIQRIVDGVLSFRVLVALIASIGLAIAVTVGWYALVRADGLQVSSTFIAFLLGALTTGVVFTVLGQIAVLSGGVNWITGAMAERSTGDLLAKLGPQWTAMHNLVFQVGKAPDTWEVDVDHVAVGPYGVLTVESKYTTAPVTIKVGAMTKQMKRDVKQAQQNADRISDLLGDQAINMSVTPVLVYWGWHVTPPPEHVVKVGKVRVVSGSDFKSWSPLLATSRITADVQKVALESLRRHVSLINVDDTR